jgi:hypothetical protein
MEGGRILALALSALIGLASTSAHAAPGTRLPFVRFWTGHPTFNDLQGWTWNPDGDAPEGQALCDGVEHTLARIDSTGAPPDLRFVNVQFALALDGQSSAWITARLLAGDRVVDQATIFHPVEGFAPVRSEVQNPFHVLPVPVPLAPGAIVKLTVACVPVDPGPASAHCRHEAAPCTSGLVVYGVTFDGVENSPVQANAQSPAFPFSCQSAVLDQTVSWQAQGGRVNQATVAHLLTGGAQGPALFTTAPDGQLVSLWTVEDYAGADGGPFAYQVVYDPDWQILPSGTFTTRGQIECFSPTASTLNQEFFSFP